MRLRARTATSAAVRLKLAKLRLVIEDVEFSQRHEPSRLLIIGAACGCFAATAEEQTRKNIAATLPSTPPRSMEPVFVGPSRFVRKKYGVTRIDSIRVPNLGVCRDDTLEVYLSAEMAKRDSFDRIAALHRI